jgi:hypothetical protein
VFARIANSRVPISRYPKKEAPLKELLWVTRNSRRELEELRLFGPGEEEDPGGCGLLSEGQVASGWYQSGSVFAF